MNLPKDFVEKMKNLLGDTSEKFFQSLENQSEKGITVNFSRMSKVDFENFADFNISPINDIENGYYVNNLKFGTHILNHLGVIYSQEPSAMYPVELLDIKPQDIILDMCAAPGGKSIQILEKLNGTGLLISNEIVFNRAKILYENLCRMGFCNYIITCNSPEDYKTNNIKFDKILIDAPCGGEGMFRKDNFDINAYKNINIETNAIRQLKILNSAKDLLKDGGTLVYSTCTYDPKENEKVVAKFLSINSEFKIKHIGGYKKSLINGIKVGDFDTNHTFRRYPHIHKGEGQYMAILTKDGKEKLHNANFHINGYTEITNKDLNTIKLAFKNIADISSLQFLKKNETIYIKPNMPVDLRDLNILSTGCVVGTITNNELKINHNFYHTFGNLFYNKIELNNYDVVKYLHGEEINVDSLNGICVVTYLHIPLGGGKVVNGKLKNYYPKELRI